MSVWKRGLEKLGFIMYPERHIRGAMYVKTPTGKKYMRILITDKNDIGRMKSVFHRHGVPVVQRKTGTDRFPVLQIAVNDIAQLPPQAREWLMQIYKNATQKNSSVLQATLQRNNR